MDPTLLAIIIKDLVVPEVISFVRGHYAANGTLPTDADVIAHLALDADRYIATGQAFLARTAPPKA